LKIGLKVPKLSGKLQNKFKDKRDNANTEFQYLWGGSCEKFDEFVLEFVLKLHGCYMFMA